MPAKAQQKTEEKSLADLFENFKVQMKSPCGQRDEAISTGKEIIEKYADECSDVIPFVKMKILEFEKVDRVCKRNDRYNIAYISKNWPEFFSLSKEIIADEGDTPPTLGVMLTLVSVGFNRVAVDQVDTYNTDVIFYAIKAIQMIESGKVTTRNWGVFEPFHTKDSSLSWLNYVIGYITYHRQNNRAEGLSYFYKAIQFDGDRKNDPSIYQEFGKYYFDLAAKAENFSLRSDREKEIALARGYTDRAIDAYGRAYKILKEKDPTGEQTKALYKILQELYRFRFNLAPDGNLEGLDVYVEKLISQPMPDPSTKVEPLY